MAKVGRKHKYATHVEPRLVEIEGKCREGKTEAEIAKMLGVTERTLSTYKLEFFPLLQALRNGKAVADYKAENRLYDRVMGMEVEEVKEKAIADINDPTKVKYVPEYRIRKQLPPHPGSIKYWLNNRMKGKWQDRLDHDMSAIMVVYNAPEPDKPDDTGLGENGVE